jgi:hypothetical protein
MHGTEGTRRSVATADACGSEKAKCEESSETMTSFHPKPPGDTPPTGYHGERDACHGTLSNTVLANSERAGR